MAGHAINDRPGRGTRWRIVLWCGSALLLLLPWLAMQVTDEVRWDAADFAIFALMLACACGAFEVAVRVTGRSAYRIAIGLAILATFLLVWADLAVGIFH